MYNKAINACVFVISHKRPDNVKRMEELLGMPVTWIVGNGGYDDYIKGGAKNVYEGGGLVRSRNTALRLAREEGKPCIQLSDDLKKIKMVEFYNDGTKKGKPSTFSEAVALMIDRLKNSPFKLGGIAPTFNEYFSMRQTSVRHFIIGDFICVLPSCDLNFDEQMTLKEDYDYTIQHIQKYGGVIRNDDILCQFEHYTNAGGAVDVRTTEEEQKNISLLKKKWGAIIADNPRRENEILLKLK